MARRAWLLVAVSVVVSLAVVSGLWLNFSADPTGATHTTGTVVTVTATAADGYGLSSWGDDCAGTPTTSMTCSLTMDADKTAKATFTELTCESGPAVPNPSVNSRLVDDCARLLALRDTLSETGTLNWTPGTAMTSWTGVTVGGSPRRVTKLHLANNGLTGQVSGLIGELTGLTELRLNGNKLTGRLPSKLGQLTRLTHAYIAGNAFAGCVPPLLRTVANNDVVHVGLADCAEPIDVSCEYGPLTAGAYQFRWDDQSVPLIFDIPPGLTLRVDAVVIPEVGEDGSYAPPGLILQHYQGDSWICLDLEDGSECNRWTPSSAGVRESNSARVRGSSEADVDSLFDRLAESVWVERAGTPATSATCSLTMDADRTASATFAKNSAPTTLRYSTYDTTGQAATAGSYAFLTANGAGSQREGGDGGARQSEGSTTPVAITTYEGLRTEADTLRIHVTDGSGVSRASFYGTVGVGDTFEWREASDCWVRYLVTAVKPGTSPREFVIWPYSYTYTGCSGTVASGRSAPGDTAQGGERSPATATAMRDFTWKPAYLRTGDFKVPTWHGPWLIVPTSWTGPVPVARSLAPPVAPPAITWPPDPLPDPDLGAGWRGGITPGYPPSELEGWYSHSDGGILSAYIWQLQKWPLDVYRMGLPPSKAARINEFVIIDGRPAHVSYSRVKHDGSEAQAIIFDPATGLVYNVSDGPLARQNDPEATIELAKKFILPATATATVTPTTYALTLSAATGGSLSADPAGGSHAAGTVVTVTANAADGYGLSSWGDDCAGTPATSTTCSLTMDADRTASATFAKNSAPTTLRYSTYDTTGQAATAGSYAFLTANGAGSQREGGDEGARQSEGSTTPVAITTYEGLRTEADTLRIHVTDGSGVSRASFYGTVGVGDTFEWREASDCWVRYLVTAIKPGTSPREFVIWPYSYTYTGCSGTVASGRSAPGDTAQGGERSSATATAMRDFTWKPAYLRTGDFKVPTWHGPWVIVPTSWTGPVPVARSLAPPVAPPAITWPPDPLPDPDLGPGWRGGVHMGYGELEGWYSHADGGSLDVYIWQLQKWPLGVYRMGLPFSEAARINEFVIIDGRPAHVSYSRVKHDGSEAQAIIFDPATGLVYNVRGGPLARQNDPDATIEIAKKFILPVTPTDTAPPTATVTPTTYALALSAATGGSLSAGPAGESHAAGTVVTVTATAADGYGLSSWGDDCAGTPATSATCSLTLDADRTASATFAKNSAPTTLRYSTYDTTGAVTAAGSYAFLANGGGAQAGAERASAGATATVLTTYEGWREEADTLRINLTDGAGVSRASFYGTVTAGDMFEWRIANDCWTRYQVMRAPGAVALATDTTSNHREFGVKPVSYAFTGCGGMVAASTAGVADFGPLPVLGGLSLTVPVVHGIFQLVPAGWTGSTKPVGPRMPARPTIPSAEATSLAEARKLPHWREPELSEGWKFSYAVSGDEAEAGYFTAYYNGLDLTVSAAGINAKYSPKQASETYYNGSRTSVRETLQIAGRPARVHRSLTAKQFPTTVHVWDEATGVLYTLHWSGHAAKLIALAESMFE